MEGLILIGQSTDRLKETYENKMPKYEKLGSNLTEAIEILLKEHSIQYLKVYYRIKETDSFVGKIDRKGYDSPFEDTEDICGIRIICYYKSDIDEICRIIKQEFNVLTSQDKEELLDPDQFGYRSHHLIVKIKDGWLSTPNYRGLDNLKAEIQIRTNLMHTWAEIEHELGYKKKEDIHPNFRRKFSSISAMLEIVDEQFEDLKKDINIYRKEKIKETEEYGWSSSVTSSEMNIDTLKIFLETYFSEWKQEKEMSNYPEALSNLLAELKSYNIQFSTLIEWDKEWKDKMPEIFEAQEKALIMRPKWNEIGYTRVLMMLNIEGYMESRNYSQQFIDQMKPFLNSYQ